MSRFPFPAYPTGWFSLGVASSFQRGEVQSLRRFGRDLVVFRGEDDRIAVLDAVCPHMGAHLGGGRVRGNSIVCPFHGFAFSCEGKCVGLPVGYTGKIPPRLACRSWPARQVDGFLLVWFDAAGRPPAWEVPAHDMSGWRPLRTRSWTLRTHPQETGEGSVDLGHLRAVHQYLSAEVVEPAVMDGHRLRSSYRATRRSGLGRLLPTVTLEFAPELAGLGFSLVDTRVVELGLRYRVWVLATPVDGDVIDYRVALSFWPPTDVERVSPLLRLLPRAVAIALLERVAFDAFVSDVELDFPIWETKAYVHPPVLMKGDGPIGLYRRWARQFYSELVSEQDEQLA